MMKTQKTITSLVLIAVALLSSASTFAGQENFSGSNCVRRSGAPISYDSNGAVFNNSTTQDLSVLCHVPHTDFNSFLHTGGIERGWFMAQDLNDGRNVSCAFRGLEPTSTGTIAIVSASSSTSGFSSRRQIIDLRSLRQSFFSSYVMFCTIPRRTSRGVSKIFNYAVYQ